MSATDRPFVDRPVADLERAGCAAVGAAREWGLDPPVLMRRGMNALYRTGDIVIRVGDATAPARLAHELVAVLGDHGVPVPTAVVGLAMTLDGLAVTGWKHIEPTTVRIDWAVVGAAVRRVHELPRDVVPEGYPTPSPGSFPWWDFDALLAELADEVDPPALDGLRRAVERNRGWRDEISTHTVICHGDVHPGNVLVSDGRPVLIDWDLLCCAAPEWDHAMLSTFATRWGGDPETYAAFAEGYGRSLADDPLTVALAELRNVAATLMRVRAGRSDPAAAGEAARRLRYWRGDPGAPVWRAQ